MQLPLLPVTLQIIHSIMFLFTRRLSFSTEYLFFAKKIENQILLKVSETSLSEKSWLMAQSLSNYRGQISPRHSKSTSLNGRFIKITKYLLKSQRCLDTNTHINEAKTHIGWFFFIFPNRDWPHACFWKLFGIFF